MVAQFRSSFLSNVVSAFEASLLARRRFHVDLARTGTCDTTIARPKRDAQAKQVIKVAGGIAYLEVQCLFSACNTSLMALVTQVKLFWSIWSPCCFAAR